MQSGPSQMLLAPKQEMTSPVELLALDRSLLKGTGWRPTRILIGSAHPHLPQMFGGAQSSTDELVKHFRARGHEVGVRAGLTAEGWTGVRGRILMKLG